MILIILCYRIMNHDVLPVMFQKTVFSNFLIPMNVMLTDIQAYIYDLLISLSLKYKLTYNYL